MKNTIFCLAASLSLLGPAASYGFTADPSVGKTYREERSEVPLLRLQCDFWKIVKGTRWGFDIMLSAYSDNLEVSHFQLDARVPAYKFQAAPGDVVYSFGYRFLAGTIQPNKTFNSTDYPYYAIGELSNHQGVSVFPSGAEGSSDALPKEGVRTTLFHPGFAVPLKVEKVRANGKDNYRLRFFMPEIDLNKSQEPYVDEGAGIPEWEFSYMNVRDIVVGSKLPLECTLARSFIVILR